MTPIEIDLAIKHLTPWDIVALSGVALGALALLGMAAAGLWLAIGPAAADVAPEPPQPPAQPDQVRSLTTQQGGAL